jgi:hypothetical protein
VLLILKFKIDKSGLVTLVMHIVVSLIRILRKYIYTIQVVAVMMIWISLHYFTFEMWYIKNTLTSETFQHKLKKQKRITTIKISFLIIMILLMIMFGFNNSLGLTTNIPFYQDNAKLLSILFLCQMIFLVLINMSMLILFIYLFNFFLEYRSSILCARRLSMFNRFIVSWVNFLCLLLLVQITNDLMIGVGVAYSGNVAIFIRQPLFVYYVVTSQKMVMPVKDLFIAISFCYLYYH